ncbi:uncharacterized protein, partial [Triticum aestivum]|uniref:uncharacterized protein n=1 Tax=Triticum aestivum TaxID=4565 RepID=UPI001D0037D2
MEAELVSAKLCEAKPGYADKQAEGEGGRVPQMEALGQGGEVKRTGSRAATVRASVPSFVFSPSLPKIYQIIQGNLIEDMIDGDSRKVFAPSDSHKKKLHNCIMAVQYMKEAPVLISDADAVRVSAEYILNGDKELILAFLWNMFIHMQLPLLVNKTSLARELSRLNASAVEQPMSVTKSHMA